MTEHFFIIRLYAPMTYFLYNEYQVTTLKKITFPMKMTILRYVTVLIRVIILPSPFLYKSCFILCHLCVPGDVCCMLFVLTPVLLYM
jgi:hypothetical protein